MNLKNNNLRKMLPIVIISILLGSMATTFAVPLLPMTVFGDVYVDDVLAGAGLNVYAKFGTTEIASATTDATGHYLLSIPETSGVANGESIDLYVGTTDTGETVTLEYQNEPLEVDLYITTPVPDTGTLSITTTPVTGEVFVDGVSWGDAPQSQEVEVGTYTVTFEDKDGYDTPADQVAAVTVDALTEIEGIYVETVIPPDTGTLSITTTPVTGEVFVEGVSWGDAPQSQEVEVGPYTVSYGAVEGYTTPSDEEAVVTKDADSAVEGIYVEIVVEPQLVITYTPAIVYVNEEVTITVEADEAPIADVGLWIYNPTWDVVIGRDTDELGQCTFTPDEAGEWTIQAWKDGYTDADFATVEVLLPDTGTLSITTTPVTGEVFVEGVSWGDAPASQDVEVGTYDVTFGDVDLYTKPDAVVATVVVGETEVVLGTYTLIPQLVITYTPVTVYENDEVTITVKAEEAPIAGVPVYIHDPSEQTLLFRNTDELGQCTFTPDEVGGWTIDAIKTDYTDADPVTVTVLEYVPPVLPQLVITLSPETVYLNDEVTVTVKTEEAPIVNAEVKIHNPEGDLILLKVTDDMGTCTFTPDETGEWSIYAFKDGYKGAYTPLEVLIPDTGILSIITTPVTGEVFVEGLTWGDAPAPQEVDVGTYTVSFGAVEGYITPIAKEAVVTVDATIEVVGIYVEIVFDTGILSITTTPVDGEVFVDEEPWGTAPAPQEVEVGSYTVSFGDVEGYTTPASQEAVVTVDATIEVLGTYVEIPVGPTADFSIDEISQLTVQYDDTLTVKGSGVTAGTTVNVYWDYASGKYEHLLNNTEGKPDGTFECEIDVPSDTVGPHYLWATDISTGETVRYDIPMTMKPKIKLSPSSGLVGDDITIKGYGFTEEANFTSITFGADEITTEPAKVETDEDGYFTYTFEIAKGTEYGEYQVTAVDFYGESASATFTLGASITLDPDEGPTGTVVEVEGRGWTATETISFTIDGMTCHVVDEDVVKVKSDGTFSADIVIPCVASVGDYKVEATESGGVKGPDTDGFEVTGLQKIKLSPGFGTPGAMIDITGYNFTQIKGTEVYLDFGTLTGIKTFEMDSNGEFSGTFQAQALAFSPPDHTVLATDEYGLSDDADFRLGMMVVIISPISGPSGERVYLTGTGFDPSGDWNSTLGGELIAEGKAGIEGTIQAYFYVPTLDVGTYDLFVLDIESEIELSTPFAVTDTTRVTVDPTDAPNLYNLTVKGYNFADAVGELEFVLYNASDDWEMDVLMDPGEVDAETDVDGNFTAYWIVLDEETISIGDYMINVTGSEGLFAQVPFSLAAEVVDVQARKPLFNRGDVVQFDVSNDFKYEESFIKIWDPYDNLYWRTEVLGTWLKVEGLYTVPYYTQTSGGNPMLLAPDAPLGTWTWTFYKSGTKNISDGTFDVGPSPSALLTEQLDILSGELAGLTDAFDDVTDDISDLSVEFADRIADIEDMIDDIADDVVDDVTAEIADDLAAATDAAQEAADAVSDLEKAVGNIADSAAELADDIADSKKESTAAREAAEEAQGATQGLTGLVYGAIACSLIAALAAIVSLMQISKKIA